MGRPLGINTVQNAAFETTYGATPAAGFFKLPMVSHGLGEEQPLLEDDQLGFGREGLDPTYDVITNDGDVVVPVDTKAIGFWLRATFGAPVTTGPVNGKYTHTFKSGGGNIPSISIEYGNPDGPIFSTNYGAGVNQLKIGLARSGMLNAALSMIAQGESDPGVVSIAGAASPLTGPRFAQATGAILIDGVAAGDIVSADLGYTNNLEKLEVIRSDGRIGGFDPGVCRASGSITTRFATTALYNKARAKTAVALSFGWATDIATLTFTLPRVFLPKPKRSVSGPKGIQAVFNWQASGAAAAQLTAVLVNDVASYA
jgi:hypothetical protein